MLDFDREIWYPIGINENERKERKMTKKEIEREIEKNERRIEKNEEKIEDLEFDIKATRKAIAFWRKKLEETEKNG